MNLKNKFYQRNRNLNLPVFLALSLLAADL